MIKADPLPVLYEEIARLTGPLCGKTAECAAFRDRPTRCCERKYCDATARFALERYGITLEPTGHPDLLFMAEGGCVVPPYLRPICAVHVCSISWADHSHIENDPAKTRAYIELRRKITEEAARQGREA